MNRRTGASSWLWSRRTLATAVSVLAALVVVTPTALAQPDPGVPPPPPPPGDPAAPPPAPVDPLAAVEPAPPAPGPAEVPPAPPPGDSMAAPPAAPPAPFNPFAPAPQPEVIPEGTPAGQNPLPFTGTPPFRPPKFINPVNGSMVGVAKPIYIEFAVPIADKALAEQAIHISSNPPVPGRFYWVNDTQVRWRPQDFWPKGTVVNLDIAGTKSSFRVGDSLVATIDNKTHQMQIMRNGKLEKTFPVSMGKPGHDTPNGTYYVLEKFADIIMDSATYGVPTNSAEGYRVKVQDAVRIDNRGTFVHSAPWSTGDQGERNVSHGCINLSPANAQWFYDNFGSGDPVVIKNSVGTYNHPDGASDWQIF